MTTEDAIPGFNELSDWPSEPSLPFKIGNHGAFRDPNPYCTYYLDLVDRRGSIFPFFFDRFLGRLCYGHIEDDDNAAFLIKGSRLQIEAFSLIESLCRDQPEYVEILDRLGAPARIFELSGSAGRQCLLTGPCSAQTNGDI